METQIENLIDLGSAAAQIAIAEYTRWFFVKSLAWIGVGIACVIAAILVWKNREKWDDCGLMSFLEDLKCFIFPALIVCAALTIPLNLPTLLNPKAYAIHQLITDVQKR
jgi:hypothetical protein